MVRIMLLMVILSVVVLVGCGNQGDTQQGGCVLMEDPDTGEVGCFGCSGGICIDPAQDWVESDSTVHECMATDNGCQLGPVTDCPREYDPVCASLQVQCVKAPCPPINTTFSNACEAQKEGARILYEGECMDEPDPEGACLSFDGTWVEETQECEGMPETMCEELGGSFDACASACRNRPDAQVCTMQCVPVCDFS